eukprot:SAG31_NODE_743_length_12418_cov_3.780908_15_plen_82_part_00
MSSTDAALARRGPVLLPQCDDGVVLESDLLRKSEPHDGSSHVAAKLPSSAMDMDNTAVSESNDTGKPTTLEGCKIKYQDPM